MNIGQSIGAIARNVSTTIKGTIANTADWYNNTVETA